MSDDDRLVKPDGLTVRRLRHEHGWSPRELIDAVARSSLASTGIARTISPNVLTGIEEQSERVSYSTLCLLSGGLGCDPVDLWGEEQPGDTGGDL